MLCALGLDGAAISGIVTLPAEYYIATRLNRIRQ